MKKIVFWSVIIGLLSTTNSCKYVVLDESLPSANMSSMESMVVPAGFDYRTTTTVDVQLTLLASNDQPLSGVVVDLLDRPLDEGGKVLATAASNLGGTIKTQLSVPTYQSTLTLSPRFVGLEQNAKIAIFNGRAIAQLGGSSGSKGVLSNTRQGAIEDESGGGAMTDTTATDQAQAATISYLGTFTSTGKPNYLSLPNAVIGADFLQNVNASLPERKSVPQYHPAYLKSTNRTTLSIIEQSDVWVTFVAEGAGYQNVLGYYTYPTGNPPKNPSDITNITIVFPNASVNGSTGPLVPGNRVKLGRFQSGVTIGFVLISNGFINGKVTNGYDYIYSDDALNGATNPDLKRQSIVLHDAARNLFLFGFEDIRRDYGSCDHDFNDLVFYMTSNPVRAISTQNVLPIDKPVDTDGDGISDMYDEFPNDPTRAFSDPTAATGTLAYEDLWPAAGDYDLNDLVVDYKMWSVKNAQNLALDINMEFTFRAAGGAYNNGFGVELSVPASAVSSVTGTRITGGYIARTASGVEAGQSKAVVIVTDDVGQVLKRPSGFFVNTQSNAPRIAEVKLPIRVTFQTPQNLALGMSAPYNPFLIVNKQRGLEVHLPSFTPTEKADKSRFYTLNDGTNISKEVYYKTKNNLPFAIHLPEKFEYPVEKQAIVGAYLKFSDWAKSGGGQFKDWYQNKTGYRNPTVIFK